MFYGFDSQKGCKSPKYSSFLRPQNSSVMGVTRLKRKNRKDKSKSAVRRQSLKIQNFQPVIKSVDVEQIKEEFKAKAPKKA
jgi:hypothetical protein